MEKQTGLYFNTRHELIENTSKWLRSNGHPSDITLNCVSQLLKLSSHTTLENDLEVVVKLMGQSKDAIYAQSNEKTFEIVKPLFEAEVGYRQCGPRTKRECFGMFFAAKEKRELTGNLKIDIEHAIEYAVMYVEHGLGKDFDKY